MANEKKLDCVILGLLNHEDLTGYEIKKRMDSALRFFWNASYGSIYPTLKELVIKGFATEKSVKESGRDKKWYSITEPGREHLNNWLALPAVKDELRYETLLKLFLSDADNPEGAVWHIDNFESKIAGELPYLTGLANNLKSALGNENAHLYYYLTAILGIKTFNVYLEWCEEAKKLIQSYTN